MVYTQIIYLLTLCYLLVDEDGGATCGGAHRLLHVHVHARVGDVSECRLYSPAILPFFYCHPANFVKKLPKFTHCYWQFLARFSVLKVLPTRSWYCYSYRSQTFCISSSELDLAIRIQNGVSLCKCCVARHKLLQACEHSHILLLLAHLYPYIPTISKTC